MKRYGMVIKVRKEKEEEYVKLHSEVWPDVLKMIKECNIRNYSIYMRDGYLYSYFEYTGEDFDSDMARMASDPTTRNWWSFTDPCQEPVSTTKPGEKWALMEEIFHMD